jgi:hypothetical protein
MKNIGKVISIPVKGVTEGMQIIDEVGIIRKVITKAPGYVETRDIKGEYFNRVIVSTILKTLVVEYDDTHYSHYETHQNSIIKQLPLKYSQWQSAIDNSEVDTDKIVEFEIDHCKPITCILI